MTSLEMSDPPLSEIPLKTAQRQVKIGGNTLKTQIFRFIIYQKWFVVLKRIQLILLIGANQLLLGLVVWSIVFGMGT